jgi:hypothetical protein
MLRFGQESFPTRTGRLRHRRLDLTGNDPSGVAGQRTCGHSRSTLQAKLEDGEFHCRASRRRATYRMFAA